jgi:hypothetical protein
LPKGKKIKASHGKLGDLVSSYIPSWLPDGMAEFLDDVVSEVLEYIQDGDHLVVIEGFRRSLAKEKDSLEHAHSVHVYSCLEESRVPLRVTCGRFVGVHTLLKPRLTMSFIGFKLSAKHQPFLQVLRVGPCLSCHCKVLSQVKGRTM